MTTTPPHLSAVLAALDDPDLEVRFAEGDRLVTQGDPSDSFLVLLDGTAEVSRSDPPIRVLARLGPGELVGEVGLLTGRPRGATVRATSPVRAVRGDVVTFAALLEHGSIHDSLVELARRRVAEDLAPVPLVGPAHVALRPLLTSDRDALVDAVRHASAETLRRRFLTGGFPTERMIDYLVNVNYVDHFAWVALDAEPTDAEPVGVGRYVRLRAEPSTAEVAFTVRDDRQGAGIGTMLLGALAAVAPHAGITAFCASMRADNHAMRAVFEKVDARFSFDEPGVTRVELAVARAVRLLDDASASALRDAAHDLVTMRG